MPRINRLLSMLIVAAFLCAFASCTKNTNEPTEKAALYCSYEVVSSDCADIRRADTVCFACASGGSCKDRRDEQVSVTYNGKTCNIKLGNKLSESCQKCTEGKIVK
jgi:hypothetical protein